VALLLGAAPAMPIFRDLPAYPVVEQDLAIVVESSVLPQTWSTFSAGRWRTAEDVRVFDLYEGSQVGEGKKSLALRLSFRAPDRLSERSRSERNSGGQW
jgi:phenylalanyl-tRNA synthetase beta chain